MHTIRLTPLEEDTGTRLDSFLSRRVEGLTRSAAARLLEFPMEGGMVSVVRPAR